MKKEIMIGLILALLIFLYSLGLDVTPFILLSIICSILFVVLQKKGVLKMESYQDVSSGVEFNFEKIGGQSVAKQELIEALEFLIKSNEIVDRGIRPLKGVLLTGPPGTGKTLLAKAAATFSDAVFLTTSGSEFIEMYAGVGAQRVRSLFNTAVEKAKKNKKNKAIIFVDEIDVLGAKRGSHTSHMEYDQTLNQFLVEMDGLNSNNQEVNILILAATNRPEILDQALLRPGRFDRQVKVDLPSLEERFEILKLHTHNKQLEDVNLHEVAKETFGFSGAHLENVANEAAILALREKSEKIKQNHFKDAVDKVMLGEKLAEKANPQILKRVAVHEAGHAFISEIVKPSSVSQVTVTSRGNALGYVRQKHEEEQKLYTESDLQNMIKVCLAGSVAEEIVLGSKSTGAENDFNKAVEIAKKIIFSGLSSLGVVSSDDLPKEKINSAIEKIIKKAEDDIKVTLSQNNKILNNIISELIKNEKINGSELRRLITS